MTLALAALVLGFFGGAHCLVMCGGIAAVLSAGVAPNLRKVQTSRGLIVVYNVGRIASYAMIGALVGWLGAALSDRVAGVTTALRIIAAFLVIGAGAWVAGIFPLYSRIESIGGPIFRRIRPIASKLLPVRHVWQAGVLGALWGFLPCGMVYAALGTAAAAASPARSAIVMVAFGAGTLPAMLLGTSAARSVVELVQLRSRNWVRRASGIAVIVLGITSGMMAAGQAIETHRFHQPDVICAP